MYQSEAYWCQKCEKTHIDECAKDEESVVQTLAYKYQTLRCWLINHVLVPGAPDAEQWKSLKAAANDVLEETK